MSSKVKVIWDMYGPHAKPTATHHSVHLKEFGEKQGIQLYGHGVEDIDPMHSIAYMIIEEKDLDDVVSALRPPRAEEFTEE